MKHRGRSKRVRFLVDSGTTYTVLTESVWRELSFEPLGEMEFILADGTVIRRKTSEVLLELPGYGERHTPVVLGESEDENLLGMVTLEIFGLILNPFRRVLRPIRALMKQGLEACQAPCKPHHNTPNSAATRQPIAGLAALGV